MAETETLEIRHQLSIDAKGYVVREVFGAQKPMVFRVATADEGKALIERRKAILMEMVASISDDAREAVENARHVDNLKAGNA